jgi:hypothetical protein
VRKFLLSLALVVFATRAFCMMKSMEFDCAELGPGARQTYEQTFQVRNRFVTSLVVAVETSNPGTAAAPKCHVKLAVTGKLATKLRLLLRHEENLAVSLNGIAFDGTSPDGSKLLLDFFSAKGDRTEHRPVVYDFLTESWQIRDVGTRVTRDFTKCDYFTMIQGVTNDGDVVLYVPKSIFQPKSCPDQGEWLLNMKADEIVRVDRTGVPKAQP